MSFHSILCTNCSAEIVQYYADAYKGRRAKCPVCNTDFPLE